MVRMAGAFAVAPLLAQWLMPFWLDRAICSRSREMFLIFLIVVSMGTAWTTLAAGLAIGFAHAGLHGGADRR